MKKIKYILIIVLIGINVNIFAQFNKAGRTALQFLKIGIGARPASLSEAVIANSNDITSVFWNPSAITNIEGGQVSFNYTQWIGDLNVFAGAAGINLSNIGVLGISYISLNYGDLQEALVTSSSGSVETRTGNTFTGSDLAVGITLARKFTDKLSIGVTAKYLRENLYTFSSSLWGFDVGTYYETGWKGIRLAMSAQNFSPQARWMFNQSEAQQSYELPLVFRIGWSIDLLGGENLFLGGNPMKNRFSLNMDAVHTNDYSERLNIGGEYWFMNLIAFRGGYRFNYDEGNLSFGVGINYETGSLKLQFDYAYVAYDFLKSPNRFSLMLAF